MSIIRVGAIQFRPILGDLEKNRKKIGQLLEKAYEQEIDIVVLPELSNSGYNFSDKDQAIKASEPIPGGKTVGLCEKLAAEYNMYIVIGINEREDDTLYNSAALIGPEGYIGKYRKVHLFMNEKNIFTRGDVYNVYDIKMAKVGIMICFDWIFPEAARSLMLKGAEIIAHPVNLVLPFWQKVCPLRALENRVFIVSANRIGIEKDLSFTGQSIIVDPCGEILARASRTHEEIIYADININIARNKNITPMNNIIEDRFPKAYSL